MEQKQLKSFKDLMVWQKAADLATLVYDITERFPSAELYGLTNQIRRSAISISSNIAEGFKRNHKKEKLQFYNVAYSSSAELESQIEIARKLNFLISGDYQKLTAIVTEIGKMIDGLIKSVNKPTKSHLPKSYILNPIFFFVFLYSIFYILNPFSVHAAEIFFEPKIQEIGLGEQFEASVFLNTEGEYINAVEGKFIFRRDLLELREIRDGNSIINFWIENPRMPIINPRIPTNDKRMATNIANENEILFSGIVPGGYKGSEGLIFSAVFLAKDTGEAEIDIRDVKLLLNDGLGTEVKRTSVKNLLVAIRENISGPSWISPEDKESPESFVPQVARDPTLFDGKWFLVFATQDKGAGIERYEIQENRKQKIENRNWIIAESPYLLKDQALKSYIYVKAIDKAGNERIAVLEPRYPLKWYENYEYWIIIVVGLVIAYAIKKFLRRKKIEARI